MDYEKAYKSLAAKVKNAHLYAQTDSTKNVLEDILPELRESEDERIRKKMIEHFKSKTKDTWCNMPVKSILAWLEKQKDAFENGRQLGIMQEQARQELEGTDEKQKEQKPELCDMGRWDEESYINGIHHVLQNPKAYGLTKQKPAEWSEDDEKNLGQVISGRYLPLGLREWFCGLPERFSSRPSWKPSELEKGALRTAIHILTEERNFPKAAEQLQNILNAFEGKESRKEWKPSEEQMDAFEESLMSVAYTENKTILESLYEQLKKL